MLNMLMVRMNSSMFDIRTIRIGSSISARANRISSSICSFEFHIGIAGHAFPVLVGLYHDCEGVIAGGQGTRGVGQGGGY